MNGLTWLWENPEQLAFIVLVVIIASTFHEFAHAATAHWFGDSTPKDQGRLTLNPKSHVDIIGMILFVLAGFGWAKPVQVNIANFKHPRTMDIIVSVAGPIMNLILAFLSLVAIFWFNQSAWGDSLSDGSYDAIILFLTQMIRLNIIWFLLNMLPIPPFDGYHVAKGFIPPRYHGYLQSYEQYAILIFFAIILIPPLNAMTLAPYFELHFDIINAMYVILSYFVN